MYITDPKIIANSFNDYFINVGRSLANNINSNVDPMLYVQRHTNNMNIPEVIEFEIKNITQDLKTRQLATMNYLHGSKRHSLQAVELSQWFQAAVQIVSNLPAPIYRFLGMPAMRTRWMAGAAAHKSG